MFNSYDAVSEEIIESLAASMTKKELVQAVEDYGFVMSASDIARTRKVVLLKMMLQDENSVRSMEGTLKRGGLYEHFMMVSRTNGTDAADRLREAIAVEAEILVTPEVAAEPEPVVEAEPEPVVEPVVESVEAVTLTPLKEWFARAEVALVFDEPAPVAAPEVVVPAPLRVVSCIDEPTVTATEYTAAPLASLKTVLAKLRTTIRIEGKLVAATKLKAHPTDWIGELGYVDRYGFILYWIGKEQTKLFLRGRGAVTTASNPVKEIAAFFAAEGYDVEAHESADLGGVCIDVFPGF